MSQTIQLDIPWQGLRMRRPKDGRFLGWSTFATSRGAFVLIEGATGFTARPLMEGDPRPDINTDDETHAGFILQQQSVTLTRVAGRWTGRAKVSTHDVLFEDPRP